MPLPDISKHKELLKVLKRDKETPFDPRNTPQTTTSERFLNRANSVKPMKQKDDSANFYDKQRDVRQ